MRNAINSGTFTLILLEGGDISNKGKSHKLWVIAFSFVLEMTNNRKLEGIFFSIVKEKNVIVDTLNPLRNPPTWESLP